MENKERQDILQIGGDQGDITTTRNVNPELDPRTGKTVSVGKPDYLKSE